MSYIVRDAEPKEVFRIVEIAQHVLSNSVYGHMAFDKEKSANFVYNAIVKRPGWFLRVISDVENDKIVGGLHAWCGVSDFGPDKLAYDITVMIDDEHRGRCIKQLTQIVDEYKMWATLEGAKVIRFGVSSGLNIDKADKFLELMGFKRVGSMHSIVVGV